MNETRRTFCSFAVDDIDAASAFYREILGMAVSAVAAEGPIWVHGPDGHATLVYPKPDHVPASFTVLNISVDDIGEAIDELEGRGVRFERYPGLQVDERGVYHAEGHSVAWFTDPAGNTLSVVQEA